MACCKNSFRDDWGGEHLRCLDVELFIALFAPLIISMLESGIATIREHEGDLGETQW